MAASNKGIRRSGVRVLREKYYITKEGNVLALLGIEVMSRASGVTTFRQSGIKDQTWSKGVWIKVGDLEPSPAPDEDDDGGDDD